MRKVRELLLVLVVGSCAGRDDVTRWLDRNYAHELPGVRNGTNGTITLRSVRGDRRFQSSDYLVDVRVSPDGASIFGAAYDDAARLWDAESGRHKMKFAVPNGGAISAEISPDGRWVAVLSNFGWGWVSTWDARTGEMKARWELRDQRRGCPEFAVSTTLIATCYGGNIDLWDPQTGVHTSQLKLRKGYGAWDVALSADGRHLAWVGASDDLVIWDTAKKRELHRISGVYGPDNKIVDHQGFDELVEIALDGKEVLATTQRGPLRRWSLMEGRPLPPLLGLEVAPFAVRYSRDGKLIAALDGSGGLTFWDRANGERLREVSPRHPGGESDEVNSFDFAPDGTWYVTGGTDGTVRRWSTADDRQLPPIVAPSSRASILLVPDPDRLLAFEAERVRVHDRVTNEVLVDLCARGILHWGSTHYAAVSPDGSLLLTSGADENLRLSSMANGELRGRWKQPDGMPLDLAFANGGRSCVAVCWNGSVWIWTPCAGESPREIFREPKGLESSSVSAVGDLIAYRLRRSRKSNDAYAEVVVRRLRDGSEVCRMRRPAESVRQLMFSPNGTRLLAAGTGIVVWDVSTGERVLGPIASGTKCEDALWSADGRWIYGIVGTRLRIWSALDGKEVDSIRVLDWASFIGAEGQLIWMHHEGGTVAVYEHRPRSR